MEISSISTLLDVIKEQTNSHQSATLFFRGQQKKFPAIIPSIARDGLINNEDSLFKEYIIRNPQEFINERTAFEKLVKMQHYNLPTRLLDITSNPLVALFFAVEIHEEYDKEDGEFIILPAAQNLIKFYDSDRVSAVSNIAKRPCSHFNLEQLDKITDTDYLIEKFNKSEQIKYLIHEIREEKPHFEPKIKREHLETIWCVKPQLKNRRIINQDGLFILFGIDGKKENIAKLNSTNIEPIVLVVKNKDKIREELELLGITYEKMYPELDTTAIALKTRYKNKAQKTNDPERLPKKPLPNFTIQFP